MRIQYWKYRECIISHGILIKHKINIGRVQIYGELYFLNAHILGTLRSRHPSSLVSADRLCSVYSRARVTQQGLIVQLHHYFSVLINFFQLFASRSLVKKNIPPFYSYWSLSPAAETSLIDPTKILNHLLYISFSHRYWFMSLGCELNDKLELESTFEITTLPSLMAN